MIFLSATGESVFQLFVVLFLFIAVLGLTYFSTKWIAGYQKAATVNKNLEVVETIRLANNRYVQIIRAGSDKYFVVGIGKDEMVSLGEVSKDELVVESDNDSATPVSFKKVMDKFTNNKSK